MVIKSIIQRKKIFIQSGLRILVFIYNFLFFVYIILIESMKHCIQQGGEHQATEILKRILEQNNVINSIGPGMIMEILHPFKIQVNSGMDQADVLQKIKDKIVDIIFQEKEQCIYYLTLPKFKNLSEHTKMALKQIMGQVWEQFQRLTENNTRNKKNEMFLCESEDLKQMEAFHLGLFNFFKASFFYGCMGNLGNQQQFFRSDFPLSLIGQNAESFPPINPLQPPMNHFLNNSALTQNKKQIAQNSNIMSLPINSMVHSIDPRMNTYSVNEAKSIFQHPSNYQRQSMKVKVEEHPANFHKVKDDYSSRQEKNQKNTRRSKRYEQRDTYTSKIKNEGNDSTLPIDKMYSKCQCKGRNIRQQRYLQCFDCKKRFHFSCLRIPLQSVEKIGVQKTCPECILRKNNVFYAVIGQPIQCLWLDQKDFCKSKINIKGKKAAQIIQNQYSIQMRFIRFSGKTMFDSDSDEKVAKKGNGFNQILIKNDMLTKGAGEQIKISLEYLQNQSKVDNPAKKSPLIYLSVYMVKARKIDQILNYKFDYWNEDYLDNYFPKDKKEGDQAIQREEELKIQIFDSQLAMIQTPARGINCQHASIFDLKEFITHAIELGSDICFFCSKKCQNFKIDGKIQAQIKKIKEKIATSEQYPSEIFYRKNGTFYWKQAPVNNDQPMQEQGVSFVSEFSNLSFSNQNQELNDNDN